MQKTGLVYLHIKVHKTGCSFTCNGLKPLQEATWTPEVGKYSDQACNLKHELVGVSSKRQSLNECVFRLVQAKSTKIPNKRQTT